MEKWDASKGTNPDTCRHYVVFPWIEKNQDVVVLCFSCGKTLSVQDRSGRNYLWDLNNKVWVHTPKKKKRSAGGPHKRMVRILDTGMVFESLSDCARAIGGSVQGVSAVVNGRAKTYKGFRMAFEHLDF